MFIGSTYFGIAGATGQKIIFSATVTPGSMERNVPRNNFIE